MKFLYRLLSQILTATLLLPIHTLQAQETPELSPNLFVRDIAIASVENGVATGSFRAISQSDNTVGGIHYRMTLLSLLPAAPEGELIADDPIVYGEELVPANLVFEPQQTQTVSFRYNLPGVPSGNYRFRIQLTTANGRDLGWWDQDVTLSTDIVRYADLRPIAVLVDSVDPRVKLSIEQDANNNISEFYPELTDAINAPEANRPEWGPLEGVNVDAGAAVQLRADATNIGTGSLTGTIVASIKRDLTATTTADTQVLQAISLTPNETETLTIPFTAPQVPGAYELFLMVRDENNNVVSSIGEYRIVVRGPSASVISVLAQKLSVTKGDPIEFTVNIVGPADSETTIAGTAEIALLDGEETVSSQSTAVQLAMEPVTIEGSLTPNRDIVGNPKLRVTLSDGSGSILDTYEVEFPRDGVAAAATPQATDSKGPGLKIIIAIGLALLLVLAGLLYWYHSSKTPVPPAATTALLVVLLVGGIFATNQSGRANHEFGTGNLAVGNYLKKTSDGGGTITFINSPMHNETLVGGQAVSYSASSTYWNCSNAANRYNYWNVSLATPGGKVSSHEKASGWTKVLAFPVAKFGTGKVTRTVSGTFTLAPSYSGNATTMWNEIWWNGHGSYALRSIMTWLNVTSPTPTPTPTATITATPTPTPTGIPTPTPTETTSSEGPTLVFTADPTSVPYEDRTTLQWSTTNAASCWAEQGWNGWKNHLGGTELSVALTQTTTFSLECWNGSGISSGKKFATVQVIQPAAPTLVFTGDPLSVPIGGTSTLEWQATNATTCTASLGWSGNKNNVSGTQVTAPLTQSTTYALSCQNAAGVSTGPEFVTITVIGGPATPTPTPTPIDDGPFQEEE